MDELERLLKSNKIDICRKCGGRMEYQQKGLYKCNICGEEVLDDFGKVNQFLDQNGPASVMKISKKTGVSAEQIDQFLKDGRIELPNDSIYFVHCEKCGCEMRYGRFCPQCAMELARGIQGQMNFKGIGEKPKDRRNLDASAKMRFIMENND